MTVSSELPEGFPESDDPAQCVFQPCAVVPTKMEDDVQLRLSLLCTTPILSRRDLFSAQLRDPCPSLEFERHLVACFGNAEVPVIVESRFEIPETVQYVHFFKYGFTPCEKLYSPPRDRPLTSKEYGRREFCIRPYSNLLCMHGLHTLPFTGGNRITRLRVKLLLAHQLSHLFRGTVTSSSPQVLSMACTE